MSENDQSQQLGPGAQPPSTPPGGPTPTPPSPPSSFAPPANTSGTGGPVPEEIKGWNWGAFWLSCIWGIAHNVWLSLLALCLWVVWPIVLGIKGSEWAWQQRRFDSIEQFKQTQAVWSKWGWIIAILSVIVIGPVILWLTVIGAAIMLPLLGQGGGLSP